MGAFSHHFASFIALSCAVKSYARVLPHPSNFCRRLSSVGTSRGQMAGTTVQGLFKLLDSEFHLARRREALFARQKAAVHDIVLEKGILPRVSGSICTGGAILLFPLFPAAMVSVILTDGRQIVGKLKGYDMTYNLVMEQCKQREYSSEGMQVRQHTPGVIQLFSAGQLRARQRPSRRVLSTSFCSRIGSMRPHQSLPIASPLPRRR